MSPISSQEADILHNFCDYNVKVGFDQPVEKSGDNCNVQLFPNIPKVNHKVPKKQFLKRFGKPVIKSLEENTLVDAPLGY